MRGIDFCHAFLIGPRTSVTAGQDVTVEIVDDITLTTDWTPVCLDGSRHYMI